MLATTTRSLAPMTRLLTTGPVPVRVAPRAVFPAATPAAAISDLDAKSRREISLRFDMSHLRTT